VSLSVWCSIPVRPLRPTLTTFCQRASNYLPLPLGWKQASSWNATKALRLGLSHAYRINKVYLDVHGNLVVFLFISHLRCIDLPTLAYFEINLSPQAGSLEYLPQVPNDDPPAMPRSVSLNGICFHYNSPRLKGTCKIGTGLPSFFHVPAVIYYILGTPDSIA
jgi:hypothetical protein